MSDDFRIHWTQTQGAPGLIPEDLVGLTIAAVHDQPDGDGGDELFVTFTNGRSVVFSGDSGWNAAGQRDGTINDLAYFDVTDTEAGRLLRERAAGPTVSAALRAIEAAGAAAAAARAEREAAKPNRDDTIFGDTLAAVADAAGADPAALVSIDDVQERLPDVASGTVIAALTELVAAREAYLTKHPVPGSKWRQAVRLTDRGRAAVRDGLADRDIDVTPKDGDPSAGQSD